MLTPKDIHDKEFKRSLRGYDLDDVDKFLDRIIKDFEELYKDNSNLKEEYDKATKKLDQYIGMENSLNRALLLAEKTAENVKLEAMAEKDRIINEARDKAIVIIDGAKEKADSFSTDNQELIEKADIFKLNLINLFEKQIKNIKEFGIIEDIPETLVDDLPMEKIIETVIEEEEEIELITPELVFQEVAKEETEEDFSSDYKEELNNGLLDDSFLDEEEEEFKNKVFKFLDK